MPQPTLFLKSDNGFKETQKDRNIRNYDTDMKLPFLPFCPA